MNTSLARTASLLLVAATLVSCEDAGPTSPDEPLRSLALQEDVEALIGGSLAGWWRAAHGTHPGPALSTAADAHTSSWRNWGMLDAGAEPRQPLRLEADYRFNITIEPWEELHRTLAAVRDGMLVLEDGLELGEGGEDTRRARAFGKFMQGMALGTLAQLYDRAFVFDEDVDPAEATLAPYGVVARAALAKLDEAEALAEGGTFTLPADWVGFAAPMDQDRFARLIRSWRARYRMSVVRTPAERAAVDWDAVLADASAGITEDWAGRYDGNHQENWAWGLDKLYTASHPAWARLDYRTIGPADASGAWLAWINSPPHARRPFPIDTDDARITGGDPTSPGIYAAWQESTLFRPERGFDHFSMYADTRFSHLFDSQGVGDYVDFPVAELDFIRAEALYRLGDRAGAMVIVNEWRAHGGLPPFTDPGQPAPGGERCVPRMSYGSCGDLFEALKYEKRIEVFHYGPFTEFLDDRGWGDLVEGTFVELPAPGDDLLVLLEDYYDEGDSAAVVELANGIGAEAVRQKREAYDRFDRARNGDPGDVGAG